MTEAKFKAKKNKKQTSDNRISTNPAYTEYSWESLAEKRPIAKKNGLGQPVNSVAATRPGARAGNNTASFGRAYADPRSNTAETARVGAKTTAQPKTKAVSKVDRKSVRVKTKVEYLTTEVEKSRRHAFPLSVVLVAACATVLIMAIITTGVQINEITSQNSELRTQYNQLVKQSDELSLLLETRDDLRVVEAMAKEELGMVKRDQVDRYYLTVHKEDKIEIIEAVKEEGPSVVDEIRSFTSSVIDRILGFFGV